MYFKTLRTSETGLKFDEFFKKQKHARNEQIELSNKYGFTTYRASYDALFGGFSSCLNFKETPDKKLWGRGAKDGEYYPKRNSKAGKAIYNEFIKMTIATKAELNSCVGINCKFSNIGYTINNTEYIGFTTNGVLDKIPNDCIEITYTEYNNL